MALKFTPDKLEAAFKSFLDSLKAEKNKEATEQQQEKSQHEPIPTANFHRIAYRIGFPNENSRYPNIVVRNPSDRVRNLMSATYFERYIHDDVRYDPNSEDDYRRVILWLQHTKVKYEVDPLRVGVRKIPEHLTYDDIKGAFAEHDYLVEHIKKIGKKLHYIELGGGRDNISILDTHFLGNFGVEVEVWRGKPIPRDITQQPSHCQVSRRCESSAQKPVNSVTHQSQSQSEVSSVKSSSVLGKGAIPSAQKDLVCTEMTLSSQDNDPRSRAANNADLIRVEFIRNATTSAVPNYTSFEDFPASMEALKQFAVAVSEIATNLTIGFLTELKGTANNKAQESLE